MLCHKSQEKESMLDEGAGMFLIPPVLIMRKALYFGKRLGLEIAHGFTHPSSIYYKACEEP
jgi:hypothetical protein